MLLQKCRLRLVNPACNPFSEKVNAIAEFEDDLRELLPYLNAELGPGMYNQDVPFLRLLKVGRPITIHPRKIAIQKLKDGQEANEVLEWLKETINSVNERRGEIQPSYKSTANIDTLAVFKHLPRTNCGDCGRKTCLAFAAAVAMGEADVKECPPFSSEKFKEQRKILLKLLGMK